MRADTELFKDKIEVSLDGRQIFYLFFGGAVLASLVFVLGVMVGKRVEARAHVDSLPATSAAVDPLAALDALARRPVAASEDELAFPSALAGDSGKATLGDVALGEVDRVLASVAARRAPVTAARPEASARASRGRADAAAQAPDRAASDNEAGDAATPSKPEGKPEQQAEKQRAKFTLQLSSFQDRAEADSFHARLGEAGYKPYMIESEVDGGTWYRVRLGGYPTYDAAIEAKTDFEKRMQIIAYVTRL